MPIVFVHGVSVRQGMDYQESERLRDALFRKFVLDELPGEPKGGKVVNPYWGRDAARFAWDHASLPRANVERLGTSGADAIVLLSHAEEHGTVIEDEKGVVLSVARKSGLGEAIDLLWALAGDGADTHQAEAMAALAIPALALAEADARPGWLAGVRDDEEFFAQFKIEVAGQAAHAAGREPTGSASAVETLGRPGLWDRIGDGLERARNAARHAAGRALIEFARDDLHRKAALFLGDVFVYLRQQPKGADGPIARRVIADLEEARSAGGPLIVVAHSMGGNIMYDILTMFRPDLAIDALVTVGSQVGVFEELKLFAASDESFPPDPNARTKPRVSRQANVGIWLNIFDQNDVLGFAAADIFDGVTDFAYSTGQGVFAAHGSYFSRPRFHARLGARLGKLLCPHRGSDRGAPA
jgi:hypothetical protein